MRIHEQCVPNTPDTDTTDGVVSDCGDTEDLLRRHPDRCEHLWIPTTKDGFDGCPFCASIKSRMPLVILPHTDTD